MKLKSFYLERYFSKFEFSSRYLLSSSDCDGLALDEVLSLADPAELDYWKDLRLGYTESVGLPALRETIAGLYQNVSADDVVVMSPGEANFIFMNVMLNKGDHVICIAPAYQSLYEVAKGIGCELSFWHSTSAPGNAWYYDPEELQKLFRKETRLLIINFPHNPTGYLPGQADYRTIVNLARERDVFVFSDEMYHLLERQSQDTLTPLCEVYDRGVSLWGMAKTFALAGLRLGWIVCKQKELMREIIGYKDYLTICSSAPSEVLALIALRHKDLIVAQNKEKILRNVYLFEEFCNGNRHIFSFSPPDAGSTAFVKLLINEPSLTFSENLVKKTGIMTLPSEMFEYGSQHLRIGFGRKSMGEILPVFHDYLRKNYPAN